MTRKDYVVLAEALKGALPGRDMDSFRPFAGWLRAVNAVADALAKDNPRFSRAKFLDAVTEKNLSDYRDDCDREDGAL